MNYRGSLGFGQDSVYSLPGNVGTQDVRDVQVWPQHVVLTPRHPTCLRVPPRRSSRATCLSGCPLWWQLCVERVLQESSLDAGRVALVGGSHGGFLACHLLGQFPDTYHACVVRNPVVNIASMVAATDIPDW